MQTTSIEFYIFVVATLIIYWLVSNKSRPVILLFTSIAFYVFVDYRFFLIIAAEIIVSFYIAIGFRKWGGKRKKIWYTLSVILCAACLFIFKYYDFFINSIAFSLEAVHLKANMSTLNLVIPAGISFYSLEVISYLTDSYRGKKVDNGILTYAAGVLFFPKLLAGPIERQVSFSKEIKKDKYFSEQYFFSGAKRILVGLYKKLVIADSVGVLVDSVFYNVGLYSGFSLVIVVLLYTIQIYADFSGYSDIAVGVSRFFGIELTENFRAPYYSSSLKEFWKRWHISLSSWFKDYIYIPLGGNRCSAVKQDFNLMITFAVSGLWHGTSWTYILWGLIHGIGQVLEKHLSKKPSQIVGRTIVFAFVSFAWIFFRAESAKDAMWIITNCFVGIGNPIAYILKGISPEGLGLGKFGVAQYLILYIIPMILFDKMTNRRSMITEKRNTIFRIIEFLFFVLLGVLILLLANKGGAGKFVYQQF